MGDFIPEDDEPTETELAHADDTPWDAGVPADDMNGGDEPSALQRAAEISEKVEEVCAELDDIGDSLEASLNATLVNFREKLAHVKGACRFYANSQLEHVVGVSQSTQMVLEKLQRFTLSLKSTLGDG